MDGKKVRMITKEEENALEYRLAKVEAKLIMYEAPKYDNIMVYLGSINDVVTSIKNGIERIRGHYFNYNITVLASEVQLIEKTYSLLEEQINNQRFVKLNQKG